MVRIEIARITHHYIVSGAAQDEDFAQIAYRQECLCYLEDSTTQQ